MTHTNPAGMYHKLSFSFYSLGAILLIAGLLLNLAVTPVQAAWDGSNLVFSPSTCTGSCQMIKAIVCNVGTGSMSSISSYEVWFNASGSPSNGQIVSSGTIPILAAGACKTIVLNTSRVSSNAPNYPNGNFSVRAYQTADNPNNSSVWSGSCQLLTGPVCLVPTATLVSTATNVPTSTATVPVSTATNTLTFTATVPVSTATNTPTFTPTVPVSTATNTPTFTATIPGPTATNTPTFTATSISSATPLPTVTAGVTLAVTPTTGLPTATPTIGNTPIVETATPLPTVVSTDQTTQEPTITQPTSEVTVTPGTGETPGGENTPQPTGTVADVTVVATGVPSLPPPSDTGGGNGNTTSSSGVLIPVTGVDLSQTAALIHIARIALVNLGLALLGLGLIFQGLYRRSI